MATPRKRGITDPPASFTPITPNDGADLAEPVRGLYIGGTGDVTVIGVEDTDAVTFAAVPAGTQLLGRFRRVMQTNTTASDLVGLI